ncbi:MAG: histidine kinase [Chloroflexia bacterium]
MSRARQFALYAIGWAIATLFYFSQDFAKRSFAGDPTPWQNVLVPWAIGNTTWAILMPLALAAGRRWPLKEGAWRKSVPVLLLVTACLATASVAMETPILRSLGYLHPSLRQQGLFKSFSAVWVYGFHGDLLTFWIGLGLQASARYYREFQNRKQETLRLQLQLSDARLGALKMQLQPHFLFNTLNAVIVLTRQRRNQQAEETLLKLSDLLRRVLSDSSAKEVSLRNELEFLEMYLSIEQVRFQDRLTVSVDSDAEVLDALVPHLGLQPIVENAVRHGLGGSLGAVRIEIKAYRLGDQLQVTVCDDGPGFPSPNGAATGIGLANTRARLEQLYGDKGSLSTENGAVSGATVTMTLPFCLAAEAD